MDHLPSVFDTVSLTHALKHPLLLAAVVILVTVASIFSMIGYYLLSPTTSSNAEPTNVDTLPNDPVPQRGTVPLDPRSPLPTRQQTGNVKATPLQ